jgi:hypothetical protein
MRRDLFMRRGKNKTSTESSGKIHGVAVKIRRRLTGV